MASGTGETGESPDPWTGLWAERWITQIDNNGEVINSRNIWINDFSFCGVKAPLLFCVQQICVDRIMKGKSQTRQKKSAVTVSVRLLSRGLYMDRNSGDTTSNTDYRLLQILIDHMWAKSLKFLTNTEFTFIRHVSASTQQLVSDDLVRLCDLLFPFVTDVLKHLRAGLKVSHS